VTNSGTGAYVINGASNPSISFIRGHRYIINVNASGHPFWIQTVSGAYSAGNVYNTGVTNNGTQSGTVIVEVAFDAPQLYYVCQYHAGMAGSILVSNLGPTGATGATGATGSAGAAGAAGSQGIQGIQGIQGATGPAGATGSAGAAGATGAGVAAGGTVNQVLAKTSGADYATAWVTPAAGGGASTYFEVLARAVASVTTRSATLVGVGVIVSISVTGGYFSVVNRSGSTVSVPLL
jgi:hypothetical protein